MDRNKETVSIEIDLTEDDVEMEEKQPPIQYVNCNNIIMNEIIKKPTAQDDFNAYSFSQNEVLIGCPDGLLLKNKVQSFMSTDSPEESPVNFIENLQKENPQIETVFIESDEDDTEKKDTSTTRAQIKVQDMIIINNSQGIRDADRSPLLNVASTPKVFANNKMIPTNKAVNMELKLDSKPTGYDDLLLTVRKISPSKFATNFSKNASTIVLQNEKEKSLSKKYLVIPKELAPFLANHQGPISFDVPGIGPLLIPKPSDIFVSQSIPALVKTKKPVYDPLTDLKYCWRYHTNRKRDLEGFTMSDRLGFYKAEQQRTKMCAAKYNAILQKLQWSIKVKESTIKNTKISRLSMENVKLVEIDSIKKRRKMNLTQNKTQAVKLKTSSPATRPNLFSPQIGSVSPLQLSSSETDDCEPLQLSSSESDGCEVGNDLLVTKKVVFINRNGSPRGRKKRKHRGRIGNQDRKKMQTDQELLQNQRIHQTALSKRKEKARIKHKGDPNQKKGYKTENQKEKEKCASDQSSSKKRIGKQEVVSNTQNSKDWFEKGRKHKIKDSKIQDVSSIGPHKRGRPSKCSEKESSEKSNITIHKIKPCYVEITHNNLVQKALDRYNSYTLKCIQGLDKTCKIIDNLKQFQHEIEAIKPILIINENHCATMNFQDLFCKYNLVFPMAEDNQFLNLDIKNRFFAYSAKKGHIKFVKRRILCRYLAGFRET